MYCCVCDSIVFLVILLEAAIYCTLLCNSPGFKCSEVVNMWKILSTGV